MKDKQLKTKTYVDNPPIKDSTTQTTFQMRFSKSNFLFIGKWIIAFVLVIVLGSQALNGFISSKFTKDSTTETITHEYKKFVGYQDSVGKFDFLQTYDDFKELSNYVLRIKNIDEINFDYSYFINNYGSYSNCSIYSGSYLRTYNSFELPNTSVNASGLFYIVNSRYGFYYVNDRDGTYLLKESLVFNPGQYMYFHLTNPNYFTTNFNIEFARYLLNTFYDIEKEVERIPIYETTTYTYEIKDNNYNWDLKLKQLSAFKPLFKFNQSFINEDYLKYNNLISYEFIDTSAGREEIINLYKEDERLKPLFDNNYISIGGRSESGLFKDKTKMYSFIEFNFPLDYDIQGVSSAYNWVLDNYVTDFNIDSYLTESKYKIELKDILEIFKFPIQIVNNLVYDFGVLIGFITWW